MVGDDKLRMNQREVKQFKIKFQARILFSLLKIVFIEISKGHFILLPL